ncbi:hypothetical protein PIB30_100231 [Stylosanthes scabra]|uniref:Uncharacterized protein n=1 Tax=Stylosanthes scabra TaxID=79078 RepID=A0ABU6WVC5_9FABA|nr:hypothetical protein [Stylosanthes scabra]
MEFRTGRESGHGASVSGLWALNPKPTVAIPGKKIASSAVQNNGDATVGLAGRTTGRTPFSSFTNPRHFNVGDEGVGDEGTPAGLCGEVRQCWCDDDGRESGRGRVGVGVRDGWRLGIVSGKK